LLKQYDMLALLSAGFHSRLGEVELPFLTQQSTSWQTWVSQ